jgi:hypothetical protein
MIVPLRTQSQKVMVYPLRFEKVLQCSNLLANYVFRFDILSGLPFRLQEENDFLDIFRSEFAEDNSEGMWI